MSFFKKAGFNKRERSGLIILLLVGFACFVIAYLSNINKFYSELVPVDPQEVALIDSLMKNKSISNTKEKTWTNKKSVYREQSKKKLTPFNPNDFSEKDWVKFGFSSKQAISLIKYRNKIKGFKSRKDLQDAFVVNDYMFNKMKNLLIFDTLSSLESNHVNQYNPDRFKLNNWDESEIDINAVDIEGFKKLYGVGDKLAARIVKFREKLGGFYQIGQIKEVYGISDSLYSTFYNRLYLGKGDLSKLKINSCTELELKSHPYINWKKAKLIYNFRKDWVRIEDWSVLINEGLLSEDDKKKLEPYIDFD